jgi:hypothetical protein
MSQPTLDPFSLHCDLFSLHCGVPRSNFRAFFGVLVCAPPTLLRKSVVKLDDQRLHDDGSKVP